MKWRGRDRGVKLNILVGERFPRNRINGVWCSAAAACNKVRVGIIFIICFLSSSNWFVFSSSFFFWAIENRGGVGSFDCAGEQNLYWTICMCTELMYLCTDNIRHYYLSFAYLTLRQPPGDRATKAYGRVWKSLGRVCMYKYICN